jgi:hypothetical protein
MSRFEQDGNPMSSWRAPDRARSMKEHGCSTLEHQCLGLQASGVPPNCQIKRESVRK